MSQHRYTDPCKNCGEPSYNYNTPKCDRCAREERRNGTDPLTRMLFPGAAKVIAGIREHNAERAAETEQEAPADAGAREDYETYVRWAVGPVMTREEYERKGEIIREQAAAGTLSTNPYEWGTDMDAIKAGLHTVDATSDAMAETALASTIETREAITPDMAGCWLEGSQGWTNTYRVVDRAQEYGFEITEEEREALDSYSQDPDADELAWETVEGQGGLSDQATEYLQLLAPAGYVFVWDAGELSLVVESDEI